MKSEGKRGGERGGEEEGLLLILGYIPGFIYRSKAEISLQEMDD